MSGPLEVSRYVSLVVEEELDRETVRAWFKCVMDRAPYGVVSVLTSQDNEGQPQTVSLVHRETKAGHYYMVPITRDLLEKEAERIVNAWMDDHSDVDFDVEVTCIPAKPFSKPEPSSITVDQQKYADLATGFAKRQHEQWMDARVKEGWRFGQKMSEEDRTHPLLRPWEELPDRYRKVDMDQPQKLLDMLGEQGYVVVPKEDLEAIQKLLRNL